MNTFFFAENDLIHEVLGMHIHMISEFQYTLTVATIALNRKILRISYISYVRFLTTSHPNGRAWGVILDPPS